MLIEYILLATNIDTVGLLPLVNNYVTMSLFLCGNSCFVNKATRGQFCASDSGLHACIFHLE